MSGFHRTVMRNYARVIARRNGVGLTAVWDDVRALPWAARGCFATVETARHRRRVKVDRKRGRRGVSVAHAAARIQREGAMANLRRMAREIVETANDMARLRARTAGRNP